METVDAMFTYFYKMQAAIDSLSIRNIVFYIQEDMRVHLSFAAGLRTELEAFMMTNNMH